MKWSDFSPYVMPYVIGCPQPVMEHHARLKTIEFCRRTMCWARALDPITASGTSAKLFELESDSSTQILRLRSLTADGQHLEVTGDIKGAAMAAAGSMAVAAYMPNPREIATTQPLKAGTVVRIDAALAPTLSAASLDDELAPWANDIAHGVTACLMMVPGQSFTALDQAAYHQGLFEKRIQTTAAAVSRGRLRAKMGSNATYL